MPVLPYIMGDLEGGHIMVIGMGLMTFQLHVYVSVSLRLCVSLIYVPSMGVEQSNKICTP